MRPLPTCLLPCYCGHGGLVRMPAWNEHLNTLLSCEALHGLSMLGSTAVCMSLLLLVLLTPLFGCAILCFSTNSNIVAAAVRDAVVDAVDELYLANCDAEEAAHNLVVLAQGSSLGALSNPQTAVVCTRSVTSGSAQTPRRRHLLWPPLMSGYTHSLQDASSCAAGQLGSLEDIMKTMLHKDLLTDRTLKVRLPRRSTPAGGLCAELTTVIFAHSGQPSWASEPSPEDAHVCVRHAQALWDIAAGRDDAEHPTNVQVGLFD
jgi:hypothetical protein